MQKINEDQNSFFNLEVKSRLKFFMCSIIGWFHNIIKYFNANDLNIYNFLESHDENFLERLYVKIIK